MHNSRNLLGEAIAVIVVVLILAVVFYPDFASSPTHPHRNTLSNIKRIALAAVMYEEDENGLPAKESWGSALNPYIKQDAVHIFQPRKEASLFAQERPATYIAFNQELSQATKLKDGEDPRSEDVMFFGSGFLKPYEWGPLSAARTYDEPREFLVAYRSGRARWLKAMPELKSK